MPVPSIEAMTVDAIDRTTKDHPASTSGPRTNPYGRLSRRIPISQADPMSGRIRASPADLMIRRTQASPDLMGCRRDTRTVLGSNLMSRTTRTGPQDQIA
ncbi:MAG: hypothetical protein JO287_09790 [Pseudonocardiales bacterium]|nr:hypothetical protein [Pseudonocardiales bacterium]